MRARDLMLPYPVVSAGTPVIEAARLLAGQDLPGLIVVDDRDRPVTILSGTDVITMAVPAYCRMDPALARVVDEHAADVFLEQLGDATVDGALPDRHRHLPVVDEDATALEIAAVMAQTRTPLVAVAAPGGRMLGAVTLDGLLDRVLGS